MGDKMVVLNQNYCCCFWRKYVKEQKEHRDEISRVSGSTLEKVREETIALRQVDLLTTCTSCNYRPFS